MPNSLSFNEFQRELQKRNIDPNTAYMLTMVYERMGDMSKQLDEMAKMLLVYANQLQGFVQLRVADQQAIRSLHKAVHGDPGISVHSVANEPESEH